METQKFKKRLLLVDFGISSKQELNTQTTIYKKKDVENLYDDIKMGLMSDAPVTQIVKLVPMELRPKLKNYIIKSEEDLSQFVESLHDFGSFTEFWCCKNDESTQLIYGRFSSATEYSLDIFQQLEIVIGNTARLLEKVGSEMNIPYVMAERLWWGRHYSITRKSTESGDLKKSFIVIARKIEEKKDIIEEFNKYLSEKKVRSFSLEFLFQNGKLIFIDWDTENDIGVLI